jgi:PAS domain-containing protein/DNA-binding CsgD family transcriptional regulator
MNTSNSDFALFVKEDKNRSAREKGLEQTTERDFAAFVNFARTKGPAIVRSTSNDRAFVQLGTAELDGALTACDFPLVIWGTADGVVHLVNQKAADLLGLPVEHQIGRRVTDFAGPRDAIAAAAAVMASGGLDGLRAKRRLTRPNGEEIPYWVWSRVVELDGRRDVVSLCVPVAQVGRLGQDRSKPWRDLVPIAIGVTDDEWRIETVSADIREVTGFDPKGCTGSSLLDLVHPDDVPRLTGPRWGRPNAAMSRCRIRVTYRGGDWVEACVLAARLGNASPGKIGFALVGAPAGATTSSGDPVAELELSVRRVGAEARAAGVLQDVAGVPAPGDYPALRELTARQWEILSRLLRGQRVVTIARELIVSQSTVHSHLSSIFGRFAVRSQAELIELLCGRTASGGPATAGSARAARFPIRPTRARTHASQLQAASTGRERTR